MIFAPTSSELSITLPRQVRVDRGVVSALIVGGVVASAYAHGSFVAADLLPTLAAFYAFGAARKTARLRGQGTPARLRALRRLARGTWQARRVGRWQPVSAPQFSLGFGWIHMQTSAVHCAPLQATLWQHQFSSLAWRRLRLLARTHQPTTYKGDR